MMKSVHSRLLAFLTVFLSISLAEAGESPDFAAKQMLAGKANLLNDGFTVSRTLGTANFSPELRLPVQLVYDSTADESGLFGHGWRCPQLESAVEATETVLVWTTPWGERVAIPRTRGADGEAPDIQAPHADWRLAPGSSWEDGLKHGNWSICGLEQYRGWRFEYRGGRLASVRSDAGTALEFSYFGDGGLSVSQNGRAFIVLHAQDGTVSLIKINGVEYSIAYVTGTATKAPQVQEEPAGKVQVRLLQSVRTAELLPETFRYGDGGVLAETRRGEAVETFVAERQSPEEYRAQLEARRDGTEYLGPVAGRLLEDGDYRYSYSSEEGRTVTLRRKDDGAAAVFALDRALGRLKTVSFSGATRIGYYAMNPASASLGMLRKVTDGEGRVLASFRRDARSGRLMAATDRHGNTTLFTYDALGALSSVARRGAGSGDAKTVARLRNDRHGRPLEIVRLDGDGRELEFRTEIAYDEQGRPVEVSNGRGVEKLAYSAFGYPVRVTDAFGKETLCEYDGWNRPVKVTDANGVETAVSYNAFGAVAEVRKSHGGTTLSSLEFGYDGYGRPVSYTGQSGCTKRLERDGLGRILRETLPDGASIGYEYDGQGRLACVTDERGMRLSFGWDAGGLASRTTAVGQATEWRRNAEGQLLEVVSRNADGREDRHFTNAFDDFGRLVSTDYGNGQVETLAYDGDGRLAEVSRDGASASFRHDFLGRLAERREGPWTTTYEYNDWGQRTRRVMADGELVLTENREYDKFGRLAKISSESGSVEFRYDDRGRLAEQRFGRGAVRFDYDAIGRLAGKTLCDAVGATVSALRYFYDGNGRIESRLANGRLQRYSYDLRGQLTEVRNAEGNILERYAYDPAGNLLSKTAGGITTTFHYDGANQLLSRTSEGGSTVDCAYDAAGRLVKEGNRSYSYGWMDKVLSVTDGDGVRTYSYGLDGQLASATDADGAVSEFLWDGLALIRRDGVDYLNEPHPNGGSPVLASDGRAFFNDILGTSQGTLNDSGYEASSLTAFGDGADGDLFFTGKPKVDDALGYAFLFRNYRPDNGKWLTADPMGYPDGWNNLAYCKNEILQHFDYLGADSYGIIGSLTCIVGAGGEVSGGFLFDSDTGDVYVTGAAGVGIGINVSVCPLTTITYSPDGVSPEASSFIEETFGFEIYSGGWVHSGNSTTVATGMAVGSSLVTSVSGQIIVGETGSAKIFNLYDLCDVVVNGYDELINFIDSVFGNGE